MILKWLIMFLLQDYTTNAYNDAIRQRQGTTLDNFREQFFFHDFSYFLSFDVAKTSPLIKPTYSKQSPTRSRRHGKLHLMATS